MLALIFAVISLSSIDPDPIVTPAAQLHDRAVAGSGFASEGSALTSGLTTDISVAPACTFGVPQFGSSLWNNAAALSRTLTEPTCSSFGSNAPWLPQLGNGFVGLTPTTLYSPSRAIATFQAPRLPARFTSLPATLPHAQSIPGARAGAEPVFARAAAPAPAAGRRH